MENINHLIDIDLLKKFGQDLVVPLVETVSGLTQGLEGLVNAVENLDGSQTASEAGANGLRYFNNELQYARITYDIVTARPGDDPKAEGWYVLSNGEYRPAQDTAVMSGRTYYKKTAAWTTIETGDGGTTVCFIPTAASTSFTYNGSPQSLELTGYDPEFMTASHITETEGGTYTAVFSLKNTARQIWTDMTTTDKTITWTIEKAEGSVTLDTGSLTLAPGRISGTVTASVVSDGMLDVVTDDPDVTSVAVSGHEVTVSSVNRTPGDAVITVSVPETNNYTAASATFDVLCAFETVYGAQWNGTASSAWFRTDAAADFVDPVPQVKTADGWTQGSSPFDSCLPWSGMERVNDPEAGVLVKIPRFYYKWTRSGSAMKLQISDGYVEGFHVSPAHAKRGSETKDRKYVYVGAYDCDVSSYKSLAGVKPRSAIPYSDTKASYRTGIHNLGSTVWQWDISMYWTICMLYLVEFANWNSQAKIGMGCYNSSSPENTGKCDGMSYHTGTDQESRGSAGHVRYRWIEDLWGNVADFIDGIAIGNTSISCCNDPGSFKSGTYTAVASTLSGPNSGLIRQWSTPAAEGFEYALCPSAWITSNEDYSTYICDEYSHDSGSYGLRTGTGGSDSGGLFSWHCFQGRDGGDGVYSGCRLMKLP